MKNLRKGFTLVEMLIVVVIIGILASALLPRLGSAQASARDTARKSDLSQLGTTLVAYYNNRGLYPEGLGDKKASQEMIPASDIEKDLKDVADLTSLPQDPNKGNEIKNGSTTVGAGQYGYLILTKNGIAKNGFLLMARSETEGGSNWVSTENKGVIKGETSDKDATDISNIKLCTRFEKVSDDKDIVDGFDAKGVCKYKDKSQLRYIYMY